MKRILWILFLTMLFCVTASQTQVCAAQRSDKVLQKELKFVIENQIRASNKYDFEGIAKLYSPDFINSDGFGAQVYSKLVKDTWKVYPDIVYTAQIKKISGNEKYARMEVYETASAVTESSAELFSEANCVYFLKKTGENWLITAEQVVDEKSFLRYGDAKDIEMDLVAPALIDAGRAYTATLNVDVPQGTKVIASIANSRIMYPQVKPKDVFRMLPEDNVLERMFVANNDGVNEYAVASVGVVKSDDNAKTAGLAFIMTRVNVVPENKFVKPEEEDEK